jgi:hypothetical protein
VKSTQEKWEGVKAGMKGIDSRLSIQAHIYFLSKTEQSLFQKRTNLLTAESPFLQMIQEPLFGMKYA